MCLAAGLGLEKFPEGVASLRSQFWGLVLATVHTKTNFRYLQISEIAHAPGLGFEPRFHPPEGCCLPLADPGII